MVKTKKKASEKAKPESPKRGAKPEAPAPAKKPAKKGKARGAAGLSARATLPYLRLYVADGWRRDGEPAGSAMATRAECRDPERFEDFLASVPRIARAALAGRAVRAFLGGLGGGGEFGVIDQDGRLARRFSVAELAAA